MKTADSGELLPRRDLRFADDPNTPVADVMTKRSDLVVAPWKKTSIEEARRIMQSTRIEKLPLVDSDDKLRGLITAKDILKRRLFPNATKDSKGRLRVGAAIGVKGDFLDRARELEKAEVDVLVLDIAHGHSAHALEAIRSIKKKVGKDMALIAGNVATKEGARDLHQGRRGFSEGRSWQWINLHHSCRYRIRSASIDRNLRLFQRSS